jgi:hypothetical protein
MKTQNFFKSKKTISRVMKQHIKWENILSSYSTNKGLIFRIYKELKKLYTKRTNTPMNKWATELNTQLSEEVQKANKYMKKISKCIAI